MALEIVWTKRAIAGFDNTIKYLEKNFTDKEVKRLLNNPQNFLSCLNSIQKCLKKRKSKKTFIEAQLINTPYSLTG